MSFLTRILPNAGSIAMYQWTRDQQSGHPENINTTAESTSQEYALMIESLKADLLSMTHKYLQAQAEADRYAAKYTKASSQIESFPSQLRNSADTREKDKQKLSRLTDENRRLNYSLGCSRNPRRRALTCLRSRVAAAQVQCRAGAPLRVVSVRAQVLRIPSTSTWMSLPLLRTCHRRRHHRLLRRPIRLSTLQSW